MKTHLEIFKYGLAAVAVIGAGIAIGALLGIGILWLSHHHPIVLWILLAPAVVYLIGLLVWLSPPSSHPFGLGAGR